MKKINKLVNWLFLFTLINVLAGCIPKIQLETPKEGIVINMNVIVDHKINIEADDKAKEILDR